MEKELKAESNIIVLSKWDKAGVITSKRFMSSMIFYCIVFIIVFMVTLFFLPGLSNIALFFVGMSFLLLMLGTGAYFYSVYQEVAHQTFYIFTPEKLVIKVRDHQFLPVLRVLLGDYKLKQEDYNDDNETPYELRYLKEIGEKGYDKKSWGDTFLFKHRYELINKAWRYAPDEINVDEARHTIAPLQNMRKDDWKWYEDTINEWMAHARENDTGVHARHKTK